MTTPVPSTAYDIVHVSTVHATHDIRILKKECASLARAGFRVGLVIPADRDECFEGVSILAIPRRKARLLRMTLGAWDALWRVLGLETRAVHYHDPELIGVAMVLKALGRHVVVDMHEDLPRQVLGKSYLPPATRGIVWGFAHLVETLAWANADLTVAATPSILSNLPVRKTLLVQNFPIEGELAVAHPAPMAHRQPWIAFVGGLTPERGAYEMIRAFGMLPGGHPLRLRVAGHFLPQGTMEACGELGGWDRVDPLGFQSRDAVADLLGRARAGLVLYHPLPNHIESQPNKLFEYMSAGLPVIASDFPLWRDIVEGTGCGLLVDPLDPAAIARAIRWIWDHPEEAQAMGDRGRTAVQTTYNWVSESRSLVDAYERILS